MSDICYKCNKRAYFNEKIQAIDECWHKTCFKCVKCNKVLALGTYSNHGKDPYCKGCYGKSHGPKGIGFGVMADTGISRKGGNATASASASSKSSGAAPATKSTSPSGNIVSKLKFKNADNNHCAVCGKSVGFAEKLSALSHTFHKTCFKCTQCSKVLKLGDYKEHKGDPFCKTCYAKCFGPKGFGFGNTLNDTGKTY